MLISHTIGISRIIAGTWKHFLFNLLTCVAAYYAYMYVVRHYVEIPTVIPTLLGTALAFFIGFNNNQAYDRWWEARKIWGTLVNDSRTWARQILYYTLPSESLPYSELQDLRRSAILRHLGFLYALKENLRKTEAREYRQYLTDSEQEAVEREANRANAILSLQAKELDFFYRQGAVDGFRFTVLNHMIVSFCDSMGKSERIRNTIFPTTYNFYTRTFIWIFIVCVTMLTAGTTGPWSILFGTLVGYVFLTIHKIGQALLNPFDAIPTGVPLDQITRTIEINLLEMLREPEVPRPVQSINNEYIM